MTLANVRCDILSVTETPEGSWQVTVDLNVGTENNMFFNEKGELLGYLPASEDSISFDKLLKLCAKDMKEEIKKAIKKEKKKWRKRKPRKGRK